ncbi:MULTISPECIES: amino acid ABC transporter permease [Rahnella]|jgi:polar amino acid transport system permease protein|uniref:Amino acid ABC transporter permease n=1 Tax=Rahnella sp. (strain Y9602) TaxID=2703885 RepID=A0A0H3FCY9_RAHSY|nr:MULTISPECIES: amino acid ABC transporter permease [Rahnella]AFE58634.1 polar amino acid ABC transporter inner membrane subunit [Rahnella aquatilis HX2]AYA07280.1 amino acid ABC transporter permease [Rahnella aquatilis]ADW73990.1 polar amino acid ABC transporter, inner membrane subunit [Rahnella aceris]AZP51217.1 amino acid ABC transporter permease [Rahnella aquatilis]MBU9860978.1 amino acid ABC transporter permease [Rahnella aceris]
MIWHPDWAGVLSGQPLQWIISGFLTTLYVSLAGSLIATLLTVLLIALRLSTSRIARGAVAAFVSVFRNTPLLVQLLFWYFAAYGALPQSWRFYIGDNHPWATFPGNIAWLTPEFLCAAWGLALFTAAFLVEEVQAGLNSVPKGQTEAAISQGFSRKTLLLSILLPQALTNAWQPVTGQYLNLMKLSSLATGIGFSELTYQVSQIESYNAHAFEGFAVGTLLYLALGLILGGLMTAFGPKRPQRRPQAAMTEETRDGI